MGEADIICFLVVVLFMTIVGLVQGQQSSGVRWWVYVLLIPAIIVYRIFDNIREGCCLFCEIARDIMRS